jgi:hypothetical protein
MATYCERPGSGDDVVRTEGGATTAHNLGEALERLRKNLYPLWKVYREAHSDPTLPGRWREAPEGSQGWRKWRQHEHALRVLEAARSE